MTDPHVSTTVKGIPSYRPTVMGVIHMVSAGHYLAASAGYRILEEGGNAIDAGVASGIAINVTLPHMTSFGGVAPIIVYLAEAREVVTISGLGRWPRATSLELFTEKYGEIPHGMGRTVVPAAADAWLTALERYGTMSFEQVVTPALELAEKGFPISPGLASSIADHADQISGWDETAGDFMPSGSPLRTGEVLVRDGLATLFREMIEVERASTSGREAAIRAARDHFYTGEVAERMASFCQENGGYLTVEDLADFSVKVEAPEHGSYRDVDVYTCGPWCQGPSLVQILNIAERLNVGDMAHNSAPYLHALIEAVKLAFADREAYYGDPEFVDVPMEALLSKEYAAERAALFDLNKAWPEMPLHGNPWGEAVEPASPDAPVQGALWQADTSYTCIVDRWGNAFSATPSDPELEAPMVPGLGFQMSTRGSQSWLDPAHPSRLEPWKRPRLTPNPAMAMKDGALLMPFGTPGGDAQPQAMAQVFLNMADFGMDPQQAIEAPRFSSLSFPNSFWPHAYLPGEVAVEGRMSSDAVAGLESRGHKVRAWSDWDQLAGGACAIRLDRERGVLQGGADPRREGYAIGR